MRKKARARSARSARRSGKAGDGGVNERVGTGRTVRVGNGQGFWGDSALGPVSLVERGEIDYLTLDYMAEVTMSIFQKARARDPKAGYATDFVRMAERVLPRCRERGIRVIANAGGVNPQACADATAAVAAQLGLSGLKIATVTGDDLLPRLGDLLAAGEAFANLDTGAPLAPERARVQSANAYLGARPIVDALAQGADVVITGRCADASLTLAPLVHEFGWAFDDYDRLSAGMIAGHIIECGTQCTGGNFEGWSPATDLRNIGYPVAEFDADGTFTVTKPEGTGGMVTRDTVIAQVLYEIGDPAAYLSPDVTVDFTSIAIDDLGGDRVCISGARGRPPTDSYKVSATLTAGYKATGQLTVAAPGAVERAHATAALLFDRLAADGAVFAERLVEVLGASPAAPEVVLRMSVRDGDRRRVDRFGGELAAMLLCGPPGLTGFAGGRPKASEVLAHWPALIAKSHVDATIGVEVVP